MKEPGSRPEGFHLSIGSVFAGLMIFSGLESLISVSREPIARALIGMINRFVHSNALKLRETQTGWLFLSVNLVVALIFLVLGVIVGARVLRKNLTTDNSD